MYLYIVGNGFDIEHRMHSQYKHFRDFVKKRDAEIFDFLGESFDLDLEWNDFENRLAYPISEKISKIDNLDYGTYIKDDIQKLFNDWILEIDKPPLKGNARFKESSLFLSFNYTSVLEITYKINFNRICHIHGEVSGRFFNKDDCNLVFGHGMEPKNKSDKSLKACLYKDTKTCFERSKQFFDDYKMVFVEKIVIIGFSYSLIDIYYFQQIKRKCPNAKFCCGYYSDNDKKKISIFMKKLGVINFGMYDSKDLLTGNF